MSDQGTKPPTEPDDVPNAIDDMLDEDADMYDDGDDGDGPDDGDGGDTDPATGDSTVDRSAASDSNEPPLPMQLPDARAPAQTPYDPDNPKGFARVGSLFADAQGNIVTRDGRVMAAKGEPARHWSNMSKQAAQGDHFKRQNEALSRQVKSSEQIVAAAKAMNDLHQSYGLTKEEYNAGVQIMATWKQNPLQVARDIVQKTLARGINASQILGSTAGDAIEMGAIRQLIDEATAGQRQRETTERITVEQQTAARNAYDAFMARYPDAGPHTDAIAKLMQDNGLEASDAYHELRHFALKNGFDFNQPLGPQVAAAEQRTRVQPAPAPQRSTYRAPMTPGNGSANRGSLTNDAQYAPADSSWGDILNSVMRQS